MALTNSKALGAVIPIATFVLGCSFTLVVNHYQERRDVRRKAAEQVVELTQSWYEQVKQLTADLAKANDDTNAALISYSYVNNRLVLPRLVLQLGILKSDGNAKSLVSATERFLDLVAYYEPTSATSEPFLTKGPVLRCRSLLTYDPTHAVDRTGRDYLALLLPAPSKGRLRTPTEKVPQHHTSSESHKAVLD